MKSDAFLDENASIEQTVTVGNKEGTSSKTRNNDYYKIEIQSTFFLTYRSGVKKVNTLYFLR